MMRISFRPMPWLTALTLICLVILISLGTWQYHRLQWKTDLIAQIDAAAESAPFMSLAEVETTYANEQPIDFRRIALDGRFLPTTVNDGKGLHLMRSDGKTMYWRIYQPFLSGGKAAYVATARFDNNAAAPPVSTDSENLIIGYVRLVRPASKLMPDSNPAQNKWYVFNGAPKTLDWADAAGGQPVQTAYYIDENHRNPANGFRSAAMLPVRKPELRNHHLDYMLTWYSFAFILLVIYFMLHRKAGRLSFGGSDA